MSIAAISSSFVAAVRGSAPLAPVEPVARPRAEHRGGNDGGRRNQLIDAMSQALGIEGEQTKPAEQAVFRFAQALMHDLRSIDGGGAADQGNGHGRGNAWGRRDWSDLPQRVDALATAVRAAGGQAEAAAPASVPLPPAIPTGVLPAPIAADASLPVASDVPQPELPPQPNPITTTSAAVHLMQVPSSRLLEAYAALRQALGEQSGAPAADAASDDLEAFLERLSNQLAPDAPAALPTGSVVNLTA